MIVDSSAIMALLNEENDGRPLLEAAASSECRMSTATWLELGIVADARSASHGMRMDELLTALDITLVEVTAQHAQLARAAYRRFGRGSGSAARLNFGDCFAYALAVATGEPLLFAGDDFTHTDVASAHLG